MKLYQTFFCLIGLAMLTACNDTKTTPGDAAKQDESKAAAQATTNTATPAASAPATSSPDSAANTNVSSGSAEVAIIKTSEGEMVAEFWPDVAPKTVENFKKLANEKFYDGTAFHRIIKGFMIQGGDPLTKDPANKERYGTGGPGYQIKAEFNDRPHTRGVLSMARSQDPDSAGSQFFICHGEPSFLNGKYTTFGRVIKGDDVLEKIANTPVSPSPMGEPSVPEKRVEITSITIVPASSVK